MTTDIQDIKYKVTAVTNALETVSLGRFFLNGDITKEINSVPSAKLNFSDKDETVSDGILDATGTFYIEVSASTDSGQNYAVLFTGWVEDYSEELNPDGTQVVGLTAYDASTLRYSYATPNQICIGDCNFGTLMTGTTTASDGTDWSADNQGNYPNGLLYDTEYQLSDDSITDLFVDESDVPLRLSYNNGKKIEVINSWLEPYGLDFWLDTVNNQFHLVSSSRTRAYPTSNLVFSIGGNIRSMQRTRNFAIPTNKYTIIGDNTSVFYSYGPGPYEEIIQDADISSYKSAFTVAKAKYNLNTNSDDVWSLNIPPNTTQLLGKSIVIRDKVDADKLTGSVVGVKQNLSPNRWETILELEKRKNTEVKTLLQIQEELEKQRNETLSGIVFLRASSGETSYHDEIADTANNICAIGFGHTYDSESTLSGMEEPLIIKPINECYISKSVYSHSAFCALNTSEANHLIREIVLFANTNSDNKLNTFSEYLTWSRQDGNWNVDSESTYYRPILTASNRYLVSVDSIDVLSTNSGYVSYPLTPIDCISAKYITNISSDVLTPFDETTSAGKTWNLRGMAFSNEELSTMSRDMMGSATSFSCVRIQNTAGDGLSTECPIMMLFEFQVPVDPPKKARDLTTMIRLNFNAHAMLWDTALTQSHTISYYIWKSSSYAETWSWEHIGSHIGGAGDDKCYNFSTHIDVIPNLTTQYYVDDDGIFRWGVLVPTMSSPNNDATLSAYMQFVGMTVEVQEQSSSAEVDYEEIHFERAFVKLDTGAINITFPANDLIALYASATSNGNSGYTEIEGAFNILGHRDYNGPERLNIWKQGIEVPTYYKTTKMRDRSITKRIWPIEKIYKSFVAYSDDSLMREAFEQIINTKHVFVKYRTRHYTPGTPPADGVSVDYISTSFSSGTRASQSVLYLNMDGATPYGVKYKINYSCVGNDSATDQYGGTIGRASFYDTNSSLREGFDKTIFKTAYIQYDYNGDVTQDGYGGGGGSGRIIPC